MRLVTRSSRSRPRNDVKLFSSRAMSGAVRTKTNFGAFGVQKLHSSYVSHLSFAVNASVAGHGYARCGTTILFPDGSEEDLAPAPVPLIALSRGQQLFGSGLSSLRESGLTDSSEPTTMIGPIWIGVQIRGRDGRADAWTRTD